MDGFVFKGHGVQEVEGLREAFESGLGVFQRSGIAIEGWSRR